MINKVVFSKALYGRSMNQLEVRPFRISQIKQFLGTKSHQIALEADLLVGGMPEYLRLIGQESSLVLGFCKNAFLPDAYFVNEVEKIFLSTMAKNPGYRKIIEFLSKKKFATRAEILEATELSTGGTQTDLFEDLEKCGFTNRYSTLGKQDNSKISRYEISDAYLQMYYRYIKPHLKAIKAGKYSSSPIAALPQNHLAQTYGYAFERWCRRQVFSIAKALGFGDVEFDFGPIYNRKLNKENPGFQIDLVYKRADRTTTVCEIKYSQEEIGVKVGEEFNRRLGLVPFPASQRVQKVLISVGPVSSSLKDYPHFDRVLTLDEICAQIE